MLSSLLSALAASDLTQVLLFLLDTWSWTG